VYGCVAGDGGTFDYGVDCIESGPVRFLTDQGASELAPYLCPGDIPRSELLGWGLKPTTSLAKGAERCDFRFKKRGEMPVTVPEPLGK